MTNEEARAYFIDCNEKIISVAKDENNYNYETQQVEDVFMRRTFEANELAIKALDRKSVNIIDRTDYTMPEGDYYSPIAITCNKGPEN